MRIRIKLRRLDDCIFLALGAIMINVALVYGLGVKFGWWGVFFYLGLGLIVGVLMRR